MNTGVERWNSMRFYKPFNVPSLCKNNTFLSVTVTFIQVTGGPFLNKTLTYIIYIAENHQPF